MSESITIGVSYFIASFIVYKALRSIKSFQVTKKREIRVWMDGVFDLMHFGHMNAFRKAKTVGDILICGINSDASVTACKGSPILNQTERRKAVLGCKWVDEVVDDVPYIMDAKYIQYIIDKYQIDYIIHGDDPCIVAGEDVYATAKKLGTQVAL